MGGRIVDRPTVIESVRYRCWSRGEDYEAFVTEYCSEADLQSAALAGGPDGVLATALLQFKRALEMVEHAASEADRG